MRTVETDRKNIRTEMAAGFAEAEADRENIRTEMAAGFAAADAKMTAGFAETHAKFDKLAADMQTGFAKIVVARSRDVWAFSGTVAVLTLMFVVALLAGV